jgi:hypothetical protein
MFGPASNDADGLALLTAALLVAALPWVAHSRLRASAAPDASLALAGRLSRQWLLECGILLMVALTAGVEVVSGAWSAVLDASLALNAATLCAAVRAWRWRAVSA